MTNQKQFLDVHVIQTVPPSNLNRDDTGSPKTAQYGGVIRARVSSQSWKKAIRKYFKDNGAVANVGIRSLEIVDYLAKVIQEKDDTKSLGDSLILADKVLNDANISTKEDKNDKHKVVKALFFLGCRQADKLADAAIAGKTDKKELQSILKDNPAIDIALFGRMVADDPSLNEDASAQVAHAISTHEVKTEFDFYTAVDDLALEDNAGAGMLGTVEYNSSTLYRYANVAVHELLKQLGDKTATINSLKLFVEAFIESMPTGKANTFANQTLPDAVVVALRHDRPVNAVTAFENPVSAKNGGYATGSVEKLKDEFKKAEKFVAEPDAVFTINVAELGAEQDNVIVLLESLGNKLAELLVDSEEPAHENNFA